MQKSILAIIALALIDHAHAQVIFSGECPANVTVQCNFNVTAYQGIWYEYTKYPVYYEAGGKCVKGELTLEPSGDFRVVNSMVRIATNEWSSSVGSAAVVENAKLKVVFPSSPPTNATSNYWVLSTDYDNYSVVYNCKYVNETSYSLVAWILTREQHPSEEFITIGENVLSENGVALSELVVTDQTNCDAAEGSSS